MRSLPPPPPPPPPPPLPPTPLPLSVTYVERGNMDGRAREEVDGEGENTPDHEEGGGEDHHCHHHHYHHHHHHYHCLLPMWSVATWTGEPGMKWTEKVKTPRTMRRVEEKKIITATTITTTTITTTTTVRYLCGEWRRGRASRV